MQPGVWIRYLLGSRSAIREVAESRSALWTGIGLVLLTAIARNYDQSFIGEKPFLWLFGSLLFSLVSGMWLYVVVNGWFVRRGAADADGNKPAFWSGWRGFMGLFWMTAPIAWLYALPVERFLDPLSAAKANLILLGVVSLWRVLLISRVIQCLACTSFIAVFLWVLFAAAVEVLVVFFFGGAFAKALMSSMGGMRNSPEENLVINTLGTVFVGAFWTVPVAFVVALVLGRHKSCEPLPIPTATPMRWLSLAIAAVFWVAISIQPQIQLAKNFKVEQLLAGGKARAALDYLSEHQPGQFAPARPLAPKPYEHSVFEELPACFGAVQSSDAAWVRAFLVRRLDEMMAHYRPRWWSKPESVDDQVEGIRDGVTRYNPEADGLLKLLNGLDRIPEGQAWLATNRVFLQALQQMAVKPPVRIRHDSKPEVEQKADWSSLSNRLRDLLPESFAIPATNLIDAPVPLDF